MERLEAIGCPREGSHYRYKMMRDYNIPPFEGTPDTYPTWFEDDVHYLELVEYFEELPYIIERLDKQAQQAAKALNLT